MCQSFLFKNHLNRHNINYNQKNGKIPGLNQKKSWFKPKKKELVLTKKKTVCFWVFHKKKSGNRVPVP